MMNYPLFLSFSCLVYVIASENFVTISIPNNSNLLHQDKFWTSTGLSPPGPNVLAQQFLTSKDELINLLLIGSLPFNAITHIRIHWLLDLIITENETLSTNLDCEQCSSLNFTLLDQLIQNLHRLNIYPGFELMGYPRLELNSMLKYNWKELLVEILEHYINIYGSDVVKNWRFETWNEPDLKMYNILNFTTTNYLNYLQGSLTALNKFNMTWGGPAGLFKSTYNHKLCWSFLNYCRVNSCSIKFLSFHRKGNADVETIINDTMSFIEVIASNYPHLKSVPLANSEADFLSGWWKSYPWRGDVRYAASMCESVIAHSQQFISKGIKFAFISHDNAFLNYYPFFFDQRTLTARFQMNNTNPPHSQFFRKTAMNALVLLALLEDFLVPVEPPVNKNLKMLVTKTRNITIAGARISILLVYNEAMNVRPKQSFHLLVRHPVMKDTKYNILSIRNDLPHPKSVWEHFDSPIFPNKQLRFKMRQSEEVNVEKLADVPAGKIFNISLLLPMPSIVLIHFCTKTVNAPGRVTNLNFLNITLNEVLLTWSDKTVASKCLKTYEVAFYPGFCTKATIFFRINTKDTLYLSFQHVVLSSNSPSEESVQGCYKVRAVDYWDRPGEYSSMMEYL